jgi:hypothetical protein
MLGLSSFEHGIDAGVVLREAREARLTLRHAQPYNDLKARFNTTDRRRLEDRAARIALVEEVSAAAAPCGSIVCATNA